MAKNQIKPLLRLAMPVSASHVSDMLVSTADVLMVGPLGAIPLAAVQIATSATLISMLFSIGFSVAITPLAGEAYGRGDMRGVAQYVKAGFIISLVVTCLLCSLLLAMSGHLDLLGAPTEVTQQAAPFFRWVVLSFVFRILFGVFKQTAEAMSNTRAAMIINLGINVANVFLCWVFVYGNLGMPQMGAEGAGFATFLARGLAVVVAWLLFRRMDFFAPLRSSLKQIQGFTQLGKKLSAVVHDGAGIGLQILMEVLAFAIGAIMLGWISAVAVAAHGVAINMASITFMIALGIGSAATIRISNLRGQQRFTEARHVASIAFGLVFIYSCLVGTGYLLLRYWLPTLYVNDPRVIDLAAHLLLYAAVFALFDGMQVAGLGVLRGYNDVRIPTVVAAIAYIVVTIPLSYVLAFVYGYGPEGIWLGYVAGLAFASAGYLWRFLLVRKRHLQIEVAGS